MPNPNRGMLLLVVLVAAGCVGPNDRAKETPFDTTEVVDESNNQDQVVEETPDDPKDDPIDPVVIIPQQPEGRLLDCASEFVAHDGNYYSATVTEAEEGTLVEVSLHTLADGGATGFGDQVREATTEIVWSDVVASELEDGFFGFETGDNMFLVAQATERPGLFEGSIGGESNFHQDRPIGLTCWSSDFALPATYDENTGGCVGENGAAAQNDVPFAFALHTGFGQCSTFEGQLNGDAFSYPSFTGLDLRGSDLSAASLHFAHFIDVDLRGVDMTTFAFGYATIRGVVDDFTALPVDSFCSDPVSGNTYECTQ